jgi:uncharacterized protein YgiM (DUF1202 family)
MKNPLVLILILALISACAVKKPPEITVGPEPEKEKIKTKKNYLWAFKAAINVRETNNEDSEKIAQLTDGDSVIVLNNQDGWYHIETDDKKSGWIRSDLLGPKNLSIFRRAVSFIDSLRNRAGTELYFDKKLYHKRIYVSFPDSVYTSGSRVRDDTNKLVKKYQQNVYRGDVMVRVLKPGTEDEFQTSEFKGEANADPLLPPVPFGIIESIDQPNSYAISLKYLAPAGVSDRQLLETARNISGSYPLSYKKIEVIFTRKDDSEKIPCRLVFKEDPQGEDYHFEYCD